MKKLISENLNLIEEMLTTLEINKKTLENLVKLNNLKENINTKHLKKIKVGNTYKFGFSIGFVKRIDSTNKFKEYLKTNNIKDYKLVSSEEYICEDYKIILPHQIEVEFYNPEDKKI